MSIPVRHADATQIIAGARTFFVTSSIAGKRHLLQSERSANLLVRVLYDYRAQGKYLLHGFVAMPNHFHVLLTVGSNSSVERAVQFIKGGFAFRSGRELGFRSPVWEKGFSEVRVCDAVAFQRIVEYIHQNPVVRHLAQNAHEFPYSSANPGYVVDSQPQWLKPVSLAAADGIAKAMP